MSIYNHPRHARAREVVEKAASRTEIPSIRLALTEDPRGVFESTASDLLFNTSARERALVLGLGEDAIVDEAADYLLLQTLTAALAVEARATEVVS